MPTTNLPLHLSETLQSFIPTDSASKALLSHVQDLLLVPIFNHSLRVYLLATEINRREVEAGTTFQHPSGTARPFQVNRSLLFAACLFHDFGTCSSCNGPQRFEVEGADAAITFLKSLMDYSEQDLQSIWSAIVLHNTAGIAERIDPFTRLVRVAVKVDFAPSVRDSLELTQYATEIEKYLPRLEIEQCLAEAVISQATRGEIGKGLYIPESGGTWADNTKFPKATWPGILLRGHLEKVRDMGEGWRGPNPAF